MTSTVAPMPLIGNMPGFPHPIPGSLPFPGSIQSTLSVSAAPHIPRTSSATTPVQTVQVPVVPVGGGCYNDGMEVVWHGEFSRLFSSFYPPHIWYLSITNSAPQQKWKFYRDSAKVRFCCQDCGNGWTSMKGRVTFWYHLNFATNEGFVQFKLYGQQCKKCNSGKFEYVMWYPEEVSKVMCNVYNKVGQTYYGFMQPPIRIDRRPGRPRNQHNADLCQACRDGECDQARPFKPLIPLNNNIQVIANGSVPPSPVTSPTTTMVPMMGPPPPLLIPVPNTMVSTAGVPYPDSVVTVPVNLTTGSQPVLTYSVNKTVANGVVYHNGNNAAETPGKIIEIVEQQPKPVTNGIASSPIIEVNGNDNISSATDEVIKNMAAVTISPKEVVNGKAPCDSTPVK